MNNLTEIMVMEVTHLEKKEAGGIGELYIIIDNDNENSSSVSNKENSSNSNLPKQTVCVP